MAGPRGRRWLITAALVGLVALVVIGWLASSGGSDRGLGAGTTTAPGGASASAGTLGPGGSGGTAVPGGPGGTAVPGGSGGTGVPGASGGAVTAPAGMAVRALSGLPGEAAQVWRLIQRGGPFRYSQDGATFGNREGRLPARPNGYYREYTVPTPGEGDRGARRLITGRDGELYYTGDHYASFVLVDTSK
jgi:ribonuclease T1